jgi:hypothetical protein
VRYILVNAHTRTHALTRAPALTRKLVLTRTPARHGAHEMVRTMWYARHGTHACATPQRLLGWLRNAPAMDYSAAHPHQSTYLVPTVRSAEREVVSVTASARERVQACV